MHLLNVSPHRKKRSKSSGKSNYFLSQKHSTLIASAMRFVLCRIIWITRTFTLITRVLIRDKSITKRELFEKSSLLYSPTKIHFCGDSKSLKTFSAIRALNAKTIVKFFCANSKHIKKRVIIFVRFFELIEKLKKLFGLYYCHSG